MAMAAFCSDGPRAAPMARARSSEGKARKMSTTRMRMSSSHPPTAPLNRPMGTPTASDAMITSSDVPTDIQAPKSTRDQTSRPA